MSWSEIKSAINSDLNIPLDVKMDSNKFIYLAKGSGKKLTSAVTTGYKEEMMQVTSPNGGYIRDIYFPPLSYARDRDGMGEYYGITNATNISICLKIDGEVYLKLSHIRNDKKYYNSFNFSCFLIDDCYFSSSHLYNYFLGNGIEVSSIIGFKNDYEIINGESKHAFMLAKPIPFKNSFSIEILFNADVELTSKGYVQIGTGEVAYTINE